MQIKKMIASAKADFQKHVAMPPPPPKRNYGGINENRLKVVKDYRERIAKGIDRRGR